jgi:hypothetical protein
VPLLGDGDHADDLAVEPGHEHHLIIRCRVDRLLEPLTDGRPNPIRGTPRRDTDAEPRYEGQDLDRDGAVGHADTLPESRHDRVGLLRRAEGAAIEIGSPASLRAMLTSRG